MDQGFVTCWRISGIRLDHDLGGCLFILAKKEYEMKVVKKLLAPVLVVGLLLTSLVSITSRTTRNQMFCELEFRNTLRTSHLMPLVKDLLLS